MMKKITVIGLGAGDLEQLPLGVYRLLQRADHIYIRTNEHPVVQDLMKEGLHFNSFDNVYEKYDQFEEVYEEIVNVLISEALHKEILYAVPGHPFVAERTVQLLVDKCSKYGIEINIAGGQSFLDSTFTSLQIDPIEGFQFLDATSLQRQQIQYNQHIIICQMYDQFIASEVKLTLMEDLPDDYEVMILTAIGSEAEEVRKVPLYELDRQSTISNLTSLYVPPVNDEKLLYHTFSSLRSVIAILRGPDGCPWDKKQTHQSLKKYILEEAYELVDAIDNDDVWNTIEELGDVLLQVMLHAQIGDDDGLFNIDDVVRSITEKMIRRHPHVFAGERVVDSDEVVYNWEQIKQDEKKGMKHSASLLEEVPKSLPGLLRAYKYQKKAAQVGFDWDDVSPMWDKVREEIEEFQVEATNHNQKNMLTEFGDILFALVNISRYYKIDPEEAITSANNKFYKRFRFIENTVRDEGKEIESLSLEQLDEIWTSAKKKGL
ncbi:nucleoside triphosphate pyrophosphohydrolase [Cytobacillus sp. IB215316]|uniref:nucleoside triphosphate pyrophosphohydrolase n=1 Tax=Cytobacillus sp. IB215316 TaxID=3097354 RepID=UPI002A146E6B|nr:nucleoside triphosphate pyrophosphohydrolase [Cytobacillus sp. IB215316]MDX8363142.1 nucleoside triphosphate pyrophosphohydrolase [Cytobacillus sp. IB215316]